MRPRDRGAVTDRDQIDAGIDRPQERYVLGARQHPSAAELGQPGSELSFGCKVVEGDGENAGGREPKPCHDPVNAVRGDQADRVAPADAHMDQPAR